MDNHFTQIFALLRFQLRQKWLWLSLWLLGLTTFASGYVPAFEKLQKTKVRSAYLLRCKTLL
ncbi:hypothetical protein [Enterococcus cecorum]|uniref:hypothetical protein n=1 Tax=Enterococcus cecorum TaxID=44008 RepID=UPI002ACA5CF9|nr:hypothetical protein [Enterococcus cecorum]MDZ5584477.1 hypothetical protein [Enterococcus cecorum]